MRVWLAVLAALVLAGCSATNLADVIKASAGDEATWCGTITTVYGTVKFARSNLQSGDVSCNDLTMRTTPSITVPPGGTLTITQPKP